VTVHDRTFMIGSLLANHSTVIAVVIATTLSHRFGMQRNNLLFAYTPIGRNTNDVVGVSN